MGVLISSPANFLKEGTLAMFRIIILELMFVLGLMGFVSFLWSLYLIGLLGYKLIVGS